MFGVTADETGAESAQLLDEFVSWQKEMCTALELHYRLAEGKRARFILRGKLPIGAS